MKKRILSKIFYIIFFLLSFVILTATIWLKNNFGDVKIDEIIFNMKVPLRGTNMTIVYSFIKEVVLSSIILTAIVFITIITDYKTKIKMNFSFKKISINKIIYPVSPFFRLLFLIIVFFSSTAFSIYKLNMRTYISSQLTKSVFMEEEYVDPKSVEINFGENKRNLIYIYSESMESSFTSVNNGGAMQTDLIKELKLLADKNTNFSNTEKLGGGFASYGATWTVGAMVAQTSGLPLKLSINETAYGDYKTFLPGAYTIGEILKDNGYTNEIMFGSDAGYSGRRYYFKEHGDYKIWDVNTAIKLGKMTEEDKVWWGFDDNNLFKYAKEEITKLSKAGAPFNFTLLTADTHFEDGYLGEYCDTQYDDQYSNVISCQSKLIYDFVTWIEQQPFYENTTIVITGDHLTMDKDFFDDIDPNYPRTVYDVFINPAVSASNSKNRMFTTFDMFPTTLAAMGATIENDRLGLGVNLFSDKNTLLEQYGMDYMYSELWKKSSFYNEKFLY